MRPSPRWTITTVRELEATSEAIGSRRHPLFDFSSIFRDVASAREGGWSTDIPRFHLREYVARADETLAAPGAAARTNPNPVATLLRPRRPSHRAH
jgi:hypothetical protein